MQWYVLVLAMKNSSAQFGFDGEMVEELIENHQKDIRRVLTILEDNQLVASPATSASPQRGAEPPCHVTREGVRKQSPGKLLPLQKWEIARTNYEGFLVHYSESGFISLSHVFSEGKGHRAVFLPKLRLDVPQRMPSWTI